MSAWIVDGIHIDTLVTAMLAYELTVAEQATETGRMLWRENLASIHARYPDTAESDRDYPGPVDFTSASIDAYEFKLLEGRVDPTLAIIAAQSFDYQSCEHDGWDASEACRIITELIAACEASEDRYAKRYGKVGERAFSYDAGPAYAWDIGSREVYRAAEAIRSAAQRVEIATP